METLAAYLAQLKEEKGVSNETIAGAIGVSSGTLSYITSGKTKKPKPETLRKLATFFADNDAGRAATIYQEFMNRAGYLAALPQMTEEEIILRLRRDYPGVYRKIVGELEAPD